MKRRKAGEDVQNLSPSREEIETLCILHAIGPHGCHTYDLATQLGLSPGLAQVVADGIQPLISLGWVDLNDNHFSLTESGHAWLEERRSALLARST
jgi:hypothetical protein